ncbi:MAG: Type 1 glutamine amidotransferase-like domain-containing protein [Bacteroidota bacterium]
MPSIYLLADSLLLYHKEKDGQNALQSVHQHLTTADPLAVYVGAANGDAPQFYDLFRGVMKRLGINRCHHVRSHFPSEDRDALAAADLILLAGGDPILGWSVFEKTGMKALFEQKYKAETLFLGISAGAIHLSKHWFDENRSTFVPMFNWLPRLADVHDEKEDWSRLSANLARDKAEKSALGISSGSGIIYQSDGTFEVLGKSAFSFDRQEDGTWQKRELFPFSGQRYKI